MRRRAGQVKKYRCPGVDMGACGDLKDRDRVETTVLGIPELPFPQVLHVLLSTCTLPGLQGSDMTRHSGCWESQAVEEMPVN